MAMDQNPAMKLKFPAALKGAKSQAKGDADPLGLGGHNDTTNQADEGGVDDLFGDESTASDFDPETTLGDATLEDLRAAQKAKEAEASDAEAKGDDQADKSADVLGGY